MDNNQNQPENNITTPPVIPQSELKLPEETVDGQTPPPKRKFLINPLLIALLVILLGLLAAVIIWGEQLVGMILPSEKVDLPPLPEETEEQPNDEAEVQQIEQEINQNEAELKALESDLEKMETEIEAELEASATTTSSS